MQLIDQSLYSRVSALPASTPLFKIFTAYENLDAYGQARKLQDQLKSLCNNAVEISSSSLKFSLFHHERSWRYAVTEAANAEMIIIAARSEMELPYPVQGWIETLPRREQPGQTALVAVLDPNQGASSQHRLLVPYFRRVAADHGMDFFCNLDEWELPKTTSHAPSGNFPLNVRQPSYHQPFENWGLND